jgi:predicted DNA-binding transcriptional regulator AlpA
MEVIIMENPQKRWLGVEDAAEYMGMKKKSLYNRTGPKSEDPFPIKCKRLGKKLLFDRLEIDKYLESI